ncbi:MAG: hypothetical protein E7I30_19000, partial [Klebsiella pneumoniae]|nr:hypothetical protein [Klebsiella pneumoniae]
SPVGDLGYSAIDQIAQFGLSSLKVIYYSEQLFSVNTSRIYVYIFLKHFSSMNANNEDINGRIINGSPIYISRIKKPALRQVFIITDTLTAAEKYPPPAGTVHAVWTAASDG